jgi:tetratricopeptide (TPR) repeat protein
VARASLGRIDEAVAGHRAALALQQATGDEAGQVSTANSLGALLAEADRREEAREIFVLALALVRRRRQPPRSRSTLLANLGCVLVDLGRLAEARPHLEEAVLLDREVGARRSEGLAVGHLARLDALEGRLDEARAGFEAALALHRAARFPPALGLWEWGLADLASQAGSDWVDLADRAVEASAPFPDLAGLVRAGRAVMRARAGDLAGADVDLAAAHAIGIARVEIEAAGARVGARPGGSDAVVARIEATCRARGIGPAGLAGRWLAEARRVLSG